MHRFCFSLLQTSSVFLIAALLPAQSPGPLNACDLNADGVINSLDVNLAVGMSTGAITPCTATVIGGGVCNVVMVQRVINAVQGAACSRTATLSWTASSSPNVIGYRVYRSSVNGGSYAQLTPAPVPGTTFVDSSVTPGTTYHYAVTAVDSAGQESTYSNPAVAVIPSL